MKIAIRSGHNFLTQDACGLIYETTENRKVYKAVIKNLIENNFEVLDVTPDDCDVNTNLKLFYLYNLKDFISSKKMFYCIKKTASKWIQPINNL